MWENERTTNDNLNRLVEEHYLHQAFEAIDLAEGRGNRLVFLTRTGMTWVLQRGHVREEDIAYYWRGEGHWYPSYNEHAIAVHDVLTAFVKRASEAPEQAIDIRLDPHALLDGSPESSIDSSPLQDNTLIPDRVFAVRHYGRLAEFYLEVDLGTESQAQWQAKMKKYLADERLFYRSRGMRSCAVRPWATYHSRRLRRVRARRGCCDLPVAPRRRLDMFVGHCPCGSSPPFVGC